MEYVLQVERSIFGLRYWSGMTGYDGNQVIGDMKIMAQAIEHLKSGSIERI